MKNRLIDLGWALECLARASFYMGAGAFLAMKALVVIPQHPGIPNILTLPAVLLAAFGGYVLALKITQEPTPKEQREEKRLNEVYARILQELAEEKEL